MEFGSFDFFLFFLNKHQPPRPWHARLGTHLAEVPGRGRALELGTHIPASSLGQTLGALSLAAISFLCFSQSWDNMAVRTRTRSDWRAGLGAKLQAVAVWAPLGFALSPEALGSSSGGPAPSPLPGGWV